MDQPACSTQKREDDKSDPRTLLTPAVQANCVVVYTQRIGCCSYWVFNQTLQDYVKLLRQHLFGINQFNRQYSEGFALIIKFCSRSFDYNGLLHKVPSDNMYQECPIIKTLGRTRGCWMPPHEVFLSFFLEDKTSAPHLFSSCSSIPRTEFETSLVMVSCYGYEI